MKPIFYDPTARRWRRLKQVALALGAVVGVLLGALVVGILVNPVLPTLGLGLHSNPHLPQARHLRPGGAGRAPETVPQRQQPGAAARAATDTHDYLARTVAADAANPTPGHFDRIAFYVNWDDNSFVSLKRNIGSIDTLVAEWLHLADGSGRLKSDDTAKEQAAAAFVRATHPATRIVPLVNNADGGEWHSDWLKAMLADPTARSHVVQDLHSYVRERNYQGISVDFESLPASAQGDLALFMEELYTVFHKDGLIVSQSVPVDDRAFDFKRLAAANDYLILMAYDENASDNEAGPIASQAWFTRKVHDRLAEVPAEKIVVGLGSYGYDWTEGGGGAEELSFQDSLQRARESSATVEFAADAANPRYEYDDEQARHHEVWFLDAVTAFNEAVSVRGSHPRGFALWRLGSEDPTIWEVLGSVATLNSGVAARLATLHSGYDIIYEGNGEILRVTGTPTNGLRKTEFDATLGLITDEKVMSFPSGYEITRWGSTDQKQLVLTYDDGPDAAYTPKILDILRDKHVPAAFFIVGEQAERNPELLARIVAEGHEVGNHTYTHPNIALIGDERLKLEVNAVQRIFESRLGRRSLLFRPPYAEDVEPETPDQVRPLLLTSALGYYTVGLQIDPNDWASPGVDAIINRTIDQAHEGQGHVVLLHDSGGNREQTVAALPRLIDSLRSDGYQFVSLSQLVGLPPSAVNPVLPADEANTAHLQSAGYAMITWIDRLLWGLFSLGLILGVARVLTLAGLALTQWRRPARRNRQELSVAVVVPAYNERAVIVSTIRSVLESDHAGFPVIVVDDGSTDGTAALVRATFADEPRVTVLEQANGGKPAALNFGISHSSADIIVALDADTVFLRNTVGELLAGFSDEDIAAVAGCARVGNVVNLITRWQALEYITSQNLDRRAFARLNCITVVPGAVGAWRRRDVLAVGGFGNDTLAEDADLTLRLLRYGKKVSYQDSAEALTEAPERVRDFVKQRFRWMFGTLQAAWKHRAALFSRDGGALGMVALPNVLLFQIIFPLVSPIMDLLLLWTALHALIGYWQHPLADVDPGFMRALWFYALFTLIDCGTAALGFALDRKADWRLLPWLLPQRFFYRQLIYYVAIKAFITALRGPRVGWGKLERSATVSAAADKASSAAAAGPAKAEQ